MIAKERKNIDVDSTLQALTVIKYNVTDRACLNNVIISETLPVFKKTYSRNYKCSDFRLLFVNLVKFKILLFIISIIVRYFVIVHVLRVQSIDYRAVGM